MAAHLESGPPGQQLAALAEAALTSLRARLGAVRAAAPDELSLCVHDTRRKMKWLRSLLRIARPTLRDSTFTELDHAVRDVGRTLSDARAHVARRACLTSLAAHFGIPKASFERELDLLAGNLDADVTACGAALDALSRIDHGFLDTLADVDEPTLAAGIGEQLRRTRKAYRRARRAPTSHHVHEWRKEMKHHLHQIELLRSRSDELSDRLNASKGLSELLGRAHDLADLRHCLAEQPRSPGALDLPSLLEAREAELSLRALTQGRDLLRQKPGELRDMIERHFG